MYDAVTFSQYADLLLQIAIMTGAFSNILKEILTGPAQHRALKKEVFLSECKKNSILLLIYVCLF